MKRPDLFGTGRQKPTSAHCEDPLVTLACAAFDRFDKLTPFNLATSRTSLW